MTDRVLDGRVIAIAGAGGGLGPAVARSLVAAGATVALTDRSMEFLDGLVEELGVAPERVDAQAVDLLSADATHAWAASLTERFGRVDGLMHLVGGWRGGTPINESPAEDWDFLHGLLIRTVQNTSCAFHDALQASGHGRFVLISALQASAPSHTNAAYAAAKAAAETWTLALSDAFRQSGGAATANVIVINALVTPQMRAAEPDNAFTSHTDANEIADTIVWMCSDTARKLNGRRVTLGGLTAVRSFGSDNHSGAHPEVLAAIAEANVDHAKPYGADPWTARAEEVLRGHFGETAQAFLLFNGTGANVTALRACCKPWEGVICAETAHLNVDEGGAAERMGGIKLTTTPTPDGKLTPADVQRLVRRVGDEHQVQARVVSITQSTELGTLYEIEELKALTDAAHNLGLLVHADGARLANAAASLGTSLRAITTDAGVDLVSLGATKNGALGVEAVVFIDPALAEGFLYLRKQSMQLASKGRFLAAQVVALLEGDLWSRSAAHADAMAARLHTAVRELDGVTITQRVQANAVFAILDPKAIATLQAEWPFYVWDEATGEVRWMCSWDTTPEEVDAFAAAIASVTQA